MRCENRNCIIVACETRIRRGGGGYVLIGLSDQPEQLISGGIRSNREWSAFDRLVWRTSCPGVDGGRRVQ